MLFGGVSGRAAVGLQGQLDLQVLDHTLQALASFSLLLELLSQLLPVGLGLLELHVQLFDLHDGQCAKRRRERIEVSYTQMQNWAELACDAVSSPEWNI